MHISDTHPSASD